MAGDIVITDESVLEECINLLAKCTASVRSCFDRAFSDMNGLVSEWDDADYYDLINAINAYKAELDELDDKTKEMIAKAKTKIEMIHALHSMKI